MDVLSAGGGLQALGQPAMCLGPAYSLCSCRITPGSVDPPASTRSQFFQDELSTLVSPELRSNLKETDSTHLFLEAPDSFSQARLHLACLPLISRTDLTQF